MNHFRMKGPGDFTAPAEMERDDVAVLPPTPASRLIWNLAMRRAGRDAGDPIRDLPLIRRAFLRDRRLAESYGLIRQAVVSPVLLPDAKLDNWRALA